MKKLPFYLLLAVLLLAGTNAQAQGKKKAL